ncbi:MAG: CsgG/HfaB family protein [Planctomycetota bacterium]
MDRRTRSLIGILIVCAVVGCRGKDKVTVVVKPRFEYTGIRRVAVANFLNSTTSPVGQNVADSLTAKLAAYLVQSGTYEVVARDQLQTLLTEQNLSATSLIDPATAIKIGKIAAVECIIAGRLTQLQHNEHSETRYQDQYDWRNGQMVKVGSIPYQWTKRQVDVGGSLQLISTTTGQVIWSDDKSYSSWATGSPPPNSMGQCEESSVGNVAALLAKGLVPHTAEVKVPKDSIYTCKNFVAGQFMDKTDRFTTRDEQVYVVLKLTQDFTDTQILIRLFQKSNEQVVIQQEHTWSGKYGQFGFPFKMADIVQKGSTGKYEAQYYIGGQEIGVVEFEIKEASK